MTSDERRAPEAFLIPVASLGVPAPWRVGQATIHPGTDGERLIAHSPPLDSDGDLIREHVLEILQSAETGSIAVMRGFSEIEDAIDALRSSLEALRLFHLSRRDWMTTSFGLPGDVYQASIDYIATWERSAPGWRHLGDHSGWTFDDAALAAWNSSPEFLFLSDALEDPDSSEGARRAVVGTQLFGQAATEHRLPLKMIGYAAALEAWLLRRQAAPQTLKLARHVSWFGCGRHDENLCGRARPICPYLRLSPESEKDRKRLRHLRDLGNAHTAWRCSEWHRIMDWYDSRSGAAHGDPTAVDTDVASSAEYWIARYLAPPILEWLRTHPDDPVDDLEREVASIVEPSRWQEMLDALDASFPPARPPAD